MVHCRVPCTPLQLATVLRSREVSGVILLTILGLHHHNVRSYVTHSFLGVIVTQWTPNYSDLPCGSSLVTLFYSQVFVWE